MILAELTLDLADRHVQCFVSFHLWLLLRLLCGPFSGLLVRSHMPGFL